MLTTFFKPIILQRPFCAIAGVLGGLLLTQAVNYELAANSDGHFVEGAYVQWQKDTGMTRQELEPALSAAVEQGFIEIKQHNKPELFYFRVNHKVVDAKLAGVGEEPILFAFVKPIILQRPFCAIAGVLGGLLLTQAVSYELATHSEGKYFVSRTYVQWQNDTGMTRQEIDAALSTTVQQGLIEIKTDDPKLVKIRVNHKVVDAKLAGIGEEVEKEEPVAEQLPLPVPSSGEITVAPAIENKKNPTWKQASSDAEIDKVFLPLYLEHKITDWTVHQKIPKDSLKAIKELIKTYPDNAPQKFIDALTWAREGDKSTDWCREAQWGLDNLCTNNKLIKYSDAHATAMENNPEYRARVEGRH
ncbi:hypothetical protein IQ227_13715 [Anabaena aphanizomenioides LEGE 00250]|uniref:Uncharacterized protein n=1 Tax=Sphaerospermopsis aphanizomenoides LEGE 00250 TaxID=2777972 RepID=A0ABR9VEX6_9CYAN|nr:hypothetical protein [Sphaerospermopsis aphanizomenoides]MBE9237053.1 hypothetical protein [Sphaerospermopsis aphanizomenoides LEGE 00250]